MESVVVVGLGYIGLPTALLLAKGGVKVIGFDVDKEKLEKIRKGTPPFDELNLPHLMNDEEVMKNFSVSASLPSANTYIVAVPTPTKKGSADLTYILAAFKSIKEKVSRNGLIIIESTIGPSDSSETLIPEIDSWGLDCDYALCTERAIPGNTIYEMTANDRVVGVNSTDTANKVTSLYSTFVQGEIVVTDPNTAAICKVMENTFRAVNIALANEFAKIAERRGVDIWRAIELANRHPRVEILYPGPGVGGHCIPIDPYFLLDDSDTASVIEEALNINERMPYYAVEKFKQLCTLNKVMDSDPIVLLGLSYKKNVDDIRESPALIIEKELKKYFNNVVTIDPFVFKHKVDMYAELHAARAVFIATDHSQFNDLDFDSFDSLKFVYDTRNMKLKRTKRVEIFVLGK